MYLYVINYNREEEQLCKMEMKYLFNLIPNRKYFFSNKEIDADRSPFVKSVIKIIAVADTLEHLEKKIIDDKIEYDNFKVKYVNIEGKMEFNMKHRIEDIIGNAVFGEAKIHEPDIMLAVTYIENRWILGEYKRNSGIWDVHNKKPCYYCNALTTRISRAVVNIAADGDAGVKLVDPCCGIGTIVIEALSMGLDIKGYDINPKVVEGAKENIKYFGYPDVVEVGDIHKINEKYDVSIIDIPYGILSVTTRNEQISILKSARRISDKMVLISSDKMDEEIKLAGFTSVDCCEASKRNFKRYISVCI